MYDSVVAACRPYLGEQSDAFLSRQCVFHLQTAPKNVGRDDIGELARWAEISGALLIGRDKAKEMRKDIEALLRRR